MTMNLSHFLSKNTHLSRTHAAIKHHENKQEHDDDDDHDHREKKRKKKKKGWSFFLKNKLSSKISTLLGKISKGKGNRSPSSTHKSNNGSDPKDHDDVKEKQGKPTTVGEILFNGTRTTTGGGGGGDGKKMGMNRTRSLKRGVVVVKKAKVKEMMVLERKQSMRRNGSIHHHHHVEEGDELCKKRILMGFRCKPIYDQNGVISLD